MPTPIGSAAPSCSASTRRRASSCWLPSMRASRAAGRTLMRLGFVLATCELSDLELCARLAHAALHAGHQVELFLMHEAVRFAARPELGALVEAGVDVTGCATSAL